MQSSRRQFLQFAAATAMAPAFSRGAFALDYPTRPVRFLVGFSAGGSSDIAARLVGQWLTDHLGHQFVVENRPGAGSNIATEAVANAAPDGHTLLLVNTANAVNATLYDRLSFNFIRDIVPVAGLVRGPLVMAIHPSVPVKTVAEFIAYAKANPGRINMAGINGTVPHVGGELFKMMAGIDMVHVPYRGITPALADLLGGQVQVLFVSAPTSIEQIRAGRLRALTVTSSTRLAVLPEVPAMSEYLPGYEASTWLGVGAPRNTPAEIVETLNREINAGLADPKLRAGLADVDGTVLAGSPADFGRLIAEETEKWAKVVKFSGAKPD
jgi:tripartite-type tricarboxylate transporter receptor subunit TctC